MNKKLLKRLGLAEDASVDAIEAAIEAHLDQIEELKKAPAPTGAEILENNIAKKIAESGGALNREQAIMALEHQAEHGGKKKSAKK